MGFSCARYLGTAGWGCNVEADVQRENYNAYQRVWFRPRVLRNVGTVDYSSKILDFPTSMPIYITATALGKLGHKDGEVNLTKAAHKHNVIQMVSCCVRGSGLTSDPHACVVLVRRDG